MRNHYASSLLSEGSCAMGDGRSRARLSVTPCGGKGRHGKGKVFVSDLAPSLFHRGEFS